MKLQKNLNMDGDYMKFDEFLRKSIEMNEMEAKKTVAESRQKRAAELLRDSGLRQRFKYRTFENFIVTEKNKHALNAAKRFACNFTTQEKGLLFSGTVGSGKTHLAASIANHLINELYTVVYGNVTDIITRIYETYNAESEISTNQIIRALTSVDLLIIDDLGKENDSKNINTLLYQIINALYEDQRKIVVTTNLTSLEITNKIGEATVSRITGMTTPVILNDKDWRLDK